MRHAIDLLLGVLLGLFGAVVGAIGVIEGFCRRLLAGIGIQGGAQTAILVVVLLLLIVAAFRAFGRLFAILVAVLLLLLVLDAVAGGGTRFV